MPRKIDYYKSSGEKIISLFAKLLFSREKHSLIRLAQMLNCSKQTVMKNIEEIQRAYGVEVEESFEGRRKYYQIKRAVAPPQLNLTEDEINVLFMCRAFTEHLLGSDLFEDASRAIEKSLALLPKDKQVSASHFSSMKLGRIDYTPHHEIIKTLIEAMNDRKTCLISYKSVSATKPTDMYISPLMIFSFNDALYLNGLLARKPGTKYVEPKFHPVLAIHRINKVEITERSFKRPDNYDFEKHFNERFGIMQDSSFTVEVEFSKYAAEYVAERIWSPEQKSKKLKDGRLHLTFEAASKLEVIAKILSFGDQAKILKPDWLVEEMKGTVMRMAEKY
ncbi:MAG: WYL domain-containing protein [Proteobacteria bacterium]|nr:WYL domain-containing protein [Pseudomonadota bacterium]MBU1716658.1 WYL domain-containing protein [Pseudomonadota bacterium]